MVRATASGYWTRGGEALSSAWLVEAVAQGAALLLAPADGDGEPRLALAAVESASFARAPEPGETLEITVALEARLGGLVRVRGEIRADGQPLGTATVVLAGDGPAGPAGRV